MIQKLICEKNSYGKHETVLYTITSQISDVYCLLLKCEIFREILHAGIFCFVTRDFKIFMIVDVPVLIAESI